MEPDNIPTASSSQSDVGEEEAHEDEFGLEDEGDEEEIEIPSRDKSGKPLLLTIKD